MQSPVNLMHGNSLLAPEAGSGRVLSGQTLIAGSATAPLLWSDAGLSFWGGMDPSRGVVIDRHHPLYGRCVRDSILAIPSGRGSCTGSSVMLELLLSGNAPRALILAERDDILLLGVLVAKLMFGRSMPVIRIDPALFASLCEIDELHVVASDAEGPPSQRAGNEFPLATDQPRSARLLANAERKAELVLDQQDLDMLDGKQGRARQVAMEIVSHMARVGGADHLIDVTQAHIDGCIYTGSACLEFAQKLLQWGAQVAVPTTLNAISVDRCGWRAQGVPAAFGEPADALAQAYVDMGAAPTYTCAPYLLQSAPKAGEQIAWAESNAVVYANSVIGARTAKYPDFLDILMALTGRAPAYDCHLDAPRKPSIQIDVELPMGFDESFYPLLGYKVGLMAGREIPLVCGLENSSPSLDDLRAFGAAFATTSSAPMFHIAGITPEARSAEQVMAQTPTAGAQRLTLRELADAWRALNHGQTETVELVALGNPHFSGPEIAKLDRLCQGQVKANTVEVIVTTGRFVLDSPEVAASVERLRSFGVHFIVDTCWCMLQEPVIPVHARNIMTNSAKYAHYAPALLDRGICFGSLADCVAVACSGRAPNRMPSWLPLTQGQPG